MTQRQLQDDQQSLQSFHFDTDNRSEKKMNFSQNRPQSVLATNNAFKTEPRNYTNAHQAGNSAGGLLIEDVNQLNYQNPNMNQPSAANPAQNDPQNIVMKRDENRLTPLMHQLPHVRACFSINSIVQIRANDPCEGQPALVDIVNLSDMMEHYFSNLKIVSNSKNSLGNDNNQISDEFETNETSDSYDTMSVEARNEILANYRLLQEFPGPLVKENTSKAQVIQFCQKNVKECLSNSNINLIDPQSHALLWDYLALLVRQNGIVDLKTDISSLLLSGIGDSQNQWSISFPNTESSFSSAKISEVAGTNQQQDFVLVNNDGIVSPTNELNDTASSSTNKQSSQPVKKSSSQILSSDDEVNLMNKLRQFLGSGQKYDAIEFAIKYNMWPHALFLASSINNNSQAANAQVANATLNSSSLNNIAGVASNSTISTESKALNKVKLRFINSLQPNDPIHTCYQLFIGRVPSIASVCITKIFIFQILFVLIKTKLSFCWF